MAITFGTIGIDEPTTIDLRAATVRIDRGGVVEEREVVVMGDAESSLAIARVTDVAPDSTHFGAVVRQVGYVAPSTTQQVSSVGGVVTVQQNSTTWAVQLTQYSTTAQVSSVAGRVEVGEYSSAAPAANSTGLIVRQVGYSTTVQVSSLAGKVLVDQNSTVWPVQVSTISGRVLVDQNSTVWFTQALIRDSSGVAFNGVTTRPATNAQGLAVRTVLNDIQSTCFSTLGNNSTSSTIVSSAAGVRHKVFAYSITSTVQAVNTLSFASSLANPIWCVQMQSISSGISGANLAVTPPAWLFATEVASPLVFKITGSTGSYHVAFSYFSEA